MPSRSSRNKKSFLPYLVLLVIVQFVLIVYLLPKRKPPAIKPKPPKPPVVAIKGEIAIVIDDWGYSLNNIDALSQIRQRLTIAILPNRSYSGKVSEIANSHGFEVILHLPLEPHEHNGLEPNTITSDMDKDEIIGIFKNDLAQISYAKGVNNHMGSKATEDKQAMGIILKEFKSRGIYFLDSFTSSSSVCRDVAKRLGVKYARRDIFLDNEEDEVYIRKQLNKLKYRARRRGYTIGIGHDRKVTLEVLKEELPKMEKEGFKFVFVSRLAK